MDFYFPTRQIKQCSQCKGGGFVPLEDSTIVRESLEKYTTWKNNYESKFSCKEVI